jgi:hypothetical protein
MSPSARRTKFKPPPPAHCPQVVFPHGGQEREKQQLASAEDAGMVCDLLTRE